MRPARVIALVLGCLLIVPSIAVLLGGAILGGSYAFARDGDGYFEFELDRATTDTVAITAGDIAFTADPGSPDWLLDALDADVRLRVTHADRTRDVFVGIAPEAAVETYLGDVAHEQIIGLEGSTPDYRMYDGGTDIDPPSDQDFWEASASGPGTQELDWDATPGRWSAVVMNADGDAGVTVDLDVGAKAGFVLPLSMTLLIVGTISTALAVALVVTGVAGRRAGLVGEPTASPPPRQAAVKTRPTSDHPVSLEATRDLDLSRWSWLVKWFLAIPHFVVLAVLGTTFVVLTVVAAVAIVFTGRYPKGIFDFNVGVLRWTWRVSHYATTGGIGTDRYPPFSLRPRRGDAARLDIAYPERLSRGLVFVKWLLAIPHLVIVAVLTGPWVSWLGAAGHRVAFDPTGGGGVLGLLVVTAGLVLLFTGRYPPALYDLIIGCNRWIYRVAAYVAFMADRYPPFRLEQGGTEPPMPSDPSPAPRSGDADLRGSGFANHPVPTRLGHLR